MDEKITLCALVLGAFALVVMGMMPFHAVSLNPAFAASPCSSVSDIYRDLDTCDGQEVLLTGKVSGIGYSNSSKGNQYTTFSITDESAVPLKVVSYGKLSVYDGETVSVRGNFTKALKRGAYTFTNQVTTSPRDVFVAGSNRKIPLVPIAVGILAIAGASVAHRKYRRNKSRIVGKHEMGASFEDYVQRLFDQREWTIVDRTKDISREIGRKVESDSNPDFTMRHNATGKIIAVECKYRSEFSVGNKGKHGICWAEKYQIDKYNDFQEKTKYPVFAAVGVGGTPSMPEHLFLVPLYLLQLPWANRDYIGKFEMNPQGKIGLRELGIA